jgi:hypothetical protein
VSAGLGPLGDELFPAERARAVRPLVERAEVGPAGADISGSGWKGWTA